VNRGTPTVPELRFTLYFNTWTRIPRMEADDSECASLNGAILNQQEMGLDFAEDDGKHW